MHGSASGMPLDPHGMMHSAQFGFVAIIPRTVPVWSLEDSTLCTSCFEQYASLSLWGSSTSSSARSTPGRAEGPSAKAPARAAFVCAWACEAPADLSDLIGPCCRADGECAERRCDRRLPLAPAAWQTCCRLPRQGRLQVCNACLPQTVATTSVGHCRTTEASTTTENNPKPRCTRRLAKAAQAFGLALGACCKGGESRGEA